MSQISNYLKPATLLTLVVGISACNLYGKTTRLGDTNICVPNNVLFTVGSSPVAEGNSDKPVPIVRSMAINQNKVKAEIPEYLSEVGSGKSKEYIPLYSTIIRYQPFQRMVSPPEASNYDYFFSKLNPSLVGYQTDPTDYWDVFEIQPDQSRKYWGVCWYQGFDASNYINCRRSIEIEGLEFQYYVSRSNIDLYPKIDPFLRKKITEWHCD